MTAIQELAETSRRLGWEQGIAHALSLAVKFGPDNDYRLRRALIDSLDVLPPMPSKQEAK